PTLISASSERLGSAAGRVPSPNLSHCGGRGTVAAVGALLAISLGACLPARGHEIGSPVPVATAQTDANAPVQYLGVEVLSFFPHDPGAFTQGLLLSGDSLYESTGLNGRSSLRQVDRATGQVIRAVP